jgi:hypothetical protein
MNLMIMFSIASLTSSGENQSYLSSLDKEIKKWLTAADIRREIVEGLQEWFEQADNMLEAAPVVSCRRVILNLLLLKGETESEP